MMERGMKMELEERARDSADYCTACTSCIAKCPVTLANPQYKGPKFVGPAHNRMHFSDPKDYEMTLELCSNCKNCDITCPSGVSVSTLNMLERGKYYREHPEAHTQRDDMLAHGDRMAKMLDSIPLGKFCANLGMKIGKAFGVLSMMGLAGQRDMPAYAPTYFMDIFKSIKQTEYPDKVVFFPGCYINQNDPAVGVAFVEVMQANHIQVLVDPEFVCCGSPLVVTGYLDEARQNADKNVARIKHWAEQGIPVVACCTSCSLMLKNEYQELFSMVEMAEAAKNVYDAFEYLHILDSQGKFNKSFATKPSKKFIYHAPCHLRAQAMGLPALETLKDDIGVDIVNADAGCCGMSGNYGFKKENYETSMKIGSALFGKIAESGAEQVVCDCGTCREQIRHGSDKPTCHPIEILAEAYGK